ncbi:hypothetical protein K439DRAFT_1337955 [Ramaria rubella]|nr:hypothetical protein K439DRAFT_1337955 [Ramaria rubella]
MQFLESLSVRDIYVVLFTVGVSGVLMLQRSRSKDPLPPGLRPLPIVGNIFQMPRSEEWNTFKGDITYLTLLGNPMIILNSLKAVRELMDERSANYSNRPYSMMDVL